MKYLHKMKADGKELASNEYISLKYKVAYNPNPNTTPPPRNKK